MSKTYSLSEVINIVLEENGIKNTVSEESTKRQLYRAFDSLLECLDASKDILKKGGKTFNLRKRSFSLSKHFFLNCIYKRERLIKLFPRKKRLFLLRISWI